MFSYSPRFSKPTRQPVPIDKHLGSAYAMAFRGFLLEGCRPIGKHGKSGQIKGIAMKSGQFPPEGVDQEIKMDLFETEYLKTIERYNRQQERVCKQEGEGSTDGGLAIVNRFLGDLEQQLPAFIQNARGVKGPLKGLVPLLLQLDPKVLSLTVLQTTLHSLGVADNFATTVRTVGRSIEAECFRAGLLKADKKLAAKVRRAVSEARGGVKSRRCEARAYAAKAGFRIKNWSVQFATMAGGWGIDWLLNSLPDVFELEGNNEHKTIVLSDEAVELAQAATDRCATLRPVYMPKDHCPAPWDAFLSKEPLGQYLTRPLQLIRTRHKDQTAAVRAAIKDGSIQPCLDGLNALQSVAWRINARVLEVQKQCMAQDIEVEGLPGKRLPYPQEGATHREYREIRNHNLALGGEKLSSSEDHATADMFIDRPFWTPMSMDWRGRVYGYCSFNFQREDRVRALFLFDQGEPLGEEGLRWLKIHAANCAAATTPAGKTDKLPLDARVQWTDQHLNQITACAASPLTERWWMTAEDPWCFLAVSFELASALAHGPSYVCRLPVSFDGSCSGVQHLSAMMRAPEGSLVNLTPQDCPADVYATVATTAHSRITADVHSTDFSEDEAWKGEVARLALAYGIDRKVAKRNTMTWAYSSKQYGMGGQQQEDLMDDLAHKVLLGKLEEHPFGDYSRGSAERPGKAARYLGTVMYDAIEGVMSLPGQAMHFLQQIAEPMADEDKHVRWASPSGLPCINHYNVVTTELVSLYLHIKGVRVRNRILTATGEEDTVDASKAASAIAPNFVHSHDAAHMHLTAKAAAAEGIAMATVHDSFGCLPSRATRLNQIIREQFVQMYEQHDVLAEVLERASCDLTCTNRDRLPRKPHYGTLDLKGVLNAEYAFA